MSTDKTPLHAVVSVICDCLVSLASDDQARALEAARVSLGLRAPRVSDDRNPYRDAIVREPLPRVEVQMMGDRPVVVNQTNQPNQPTGGRALIVSGPQRTTVLQRRQLPAPSAPATPGSESRGYVRALRTFR